MYAPKFPPIKPDSEALVSYVIEELQSVAQSQGDPVDFVQFNILHATPKKLRDGMVVFADGTNWNPGTGAGLYQRVAGAWVKL